MKVVVTGAAGFIGSHVVDQLLNLGAEVVAIDNLSTGKSENLMCAAQHVGFEFVYDDIRDANTRRACQGADVIVHLAAVASVPESLEHPLDYDTNNVHGTLNMLEAAREQQVRRFIYSASSSAYGNAVILPHVETMVPAPVSPYAVTKLAGEHYCQAYHRSYGLPTIALRYFNVYGPRQSPENQYAAVIPNFVAKLQSGEAPTIFGDGTQTRDFVYVGDVARANVICCATLPSWVDEEVYGRVFNIAGGKQITINLLAVKLCQLLGVDVRQRYASKREGDVKHSCADIREARVCLGWEPTVDLTTGLRETVEWFQSAA